MNAYLEALRKWESDVDHEAARLITERGVPPWDAIVRARQIVTIQRRTAQETERGR